MDGDSLSNFCCDELKINRTEIACQNYIHVERYLKVFGSVGSCLVPSIIAMNTSLKISRRHCLMSTPYPRCLRSYDHKFVAAWLHVFCTIWESDIHYMSGNFEREYAWSCKASPSNIVCTMELVNICRYIIICVFWKVGK